MNTNKHKTLSRTNSSPSVILRVGHGFALGLLTVGLLSLLFFGHTSLDDLYPIIVKFLATATYIALLPGYLLVISGRCKSKRLMATVSFVSVATAAVMVLWLFGFMQDLARVSCMGFMHAVTTCVESTLTLPAIILLIPGIFICATLLLLGFVTSGLIEENQLQPRMKQITSPVQQWSKKHKRGLKMTLIIAAVYFILLILPVVSPYAKVPLYTVVCGRLPTPASSFGHYYTNAFNVSLFSDHFFCSEEEAQKAGYKK